jgi:hypothetical protein
VPAARVWHISERSEGRGESAITTAFVEKGRATPPLLAPVKQAEPAPYYLDSATFGDDSIININPVKRRCNHDVPPHGTPKVALSNYSPA